MTAPEPVQCRHCPKLITPGPAGADPPRWWEDADGFTQCAKYTGPLPVPPGGRLAHEPMPGAAAAGSPAGWPHLEAFWLDDMRRWGSMEADYGVCWHEGTRRYPTWRVSHLQATGELIAVCQSVTSGGGAGPVRLIAVIPSDPCDPGGVWYRTLEGLLDGWAEPRLHGFDLAWFARRLAARGVEVTASAW